MKVLFLTNIPSPYRVLFFEELGKLCDLTVAYELAYAIDRDKRWKEGKVSSFKEIYLNGFRTSKDTALCFNIGKVLKEKFDVIIVGGYASLTSIYAMLLFRLRGIKFILNADGGFIREESRIKYHIKKYLISKANGWLSTGNLTNVYLEHYGANPLYIFNYPFSSNLEEDILNEPLELSEKTAIREKLSIKENEVVLFVGQFIYRKGIDVLIEATKNLDKNIGIYVIGGEPEEHLVKLKEKYFLENLHFISFKTKNELKLYYRASDLFVLPTREDIWGLVINEAMANGLPVITTDRCIAGVEMIVENVNGKIVKADDAIGLSDAINSLIYDPDKLNEMASNSIDKAKMYTIEKMADCHYKIFMSFNNNQ